VAETDTASEPAVTRPEAYSPSAIHMLRTVQNNTLKLAQMADQKASILMGASFVVFSIAVSQTLSGSVPWSLAVLALFSFLSALCGALAVMPSVARPGSGGRVNKLFFGHFFAADEDEWAQDLIDHLHADEDVFRLMLRDIYQNGQVLHHRKYRFLGYAYKLFVAGLLATLVVAGIELALGQPVTY
jgi:amino acid transporter